MDKKIYKFDGKIDISDFLGGKAHRGANYYGKCNDCGEDVQWRRDKVESHLKRCTEIDPNVRASFADAEKGKKRSVSATAPSILSTPEFNSVCTPLNDGQSKITDHFLKLTPQLKADVDMKVH
jgi:hypothetical protein